jgi:nucleoid-associated protein YgaU
MLSLLLDVSLLGAGESVKGAADRLFKMMEAGGDGGGGSAPPKITFRWGSVSLPKSVPVSLTVQYVLFHPNGEPIRATVDLEVAQAEKAEKGQNPTTRAITGMRIHRVSDGDSLPSLAQDAYGDPTRWRAIAEANGVDDPLRLRRGAELTIPRLDA